MELSLSVFQGMPNYYQIVKNGDFHNVHVSNDKEIKVSDKLLLGGRYRQEFNVIEVLEKRLARGIFKGTPPTFHILKCTMKTY